MTYSSFGSTLSLSGNRQGRPTLGNENIVVVTGRADSLVGIWLPRFVGKALTRIRAVDIKPFEEWYQRFGDVENLCLDLNSKENCETAAEMPAISTISRQIWEEWASLSTTKPSACSRCSSNTQVLQAAVKYEVKRYFFSSSACVYNGDKQKSSKAPSLKEEDAYPALAEDGYGWETIF